MRGEAEPRSRRGLVGCLMVVVLLFVWQRLPERFTAEVEDLLGIVLGATLVTSVVLLFAAGGASLFGSLYLEAAVFRRAERRGWPRQRDYHHRWAMSWPTGGLVWGHGKLEVGEPGRPVLGLFALLPRRIWRRLPEWSKAAGAPLLNVPNSTESLIRALILLWQLDREWNPAEHERLPRLLRSRMDAWERCLIEAPARPQPWPWEKTRSAARRGRTETVRLEWPDKRPRSRRDP